MTDATDTIRYSSRSDPRDHRPLRISLLLSAVIVLSLLSLFHSFVPLPYQKIEKLSPATIVQLQSVPLQAAERQAVKRSQDIEETEPEDVIEDRAEPATAVVDNNEADRPDRNDETAMENVMSPPVDWPVLIESIAERSDEFAPGEPSSMSPAFDELRHVASTRYSKPQTREKKPIWENVEKDQLGRTILRSGDCYRVLDDPSAVNQWVFENFSQYLTICEIAGNSPIELPFVKEIVARYDYLKKDNGSEFDWAD